ncbi:hypothetical protein [Rhodococcus wratislaviensis]|uniref:hypothetical protein n=1 Tax=Rhodococcus wratislaviensis TaxID=44752 RepID=UPI001CEC038F|nr:hypothetical protein [Rhodococcus wratislaviensis]
MTDAATTPPLGKILTADEIARFVARVAYPTSPWFWWTRNWPGKLAGCVGSAGLGGEGPQASAGDDRRPRRDRHRRGFRAWRVATTRLGFPVAGA